MCVVEGVPAEFDISLEAFEQRSEILGKPHKRLGVVCENLVVAVEVKKVIWIFTNSRAGHGAIAITGRNSDRNHLKCVNPQVVVVVRLALDVVLVGEVDIERCVLEELNVHI